MAKKTIHQKLDEILVILNRKSSNIFAPVEHPATGPVIPPVTVTTDPLALVPDPQLRLKALGYRDQVGPGGTFTAPTSITDAYREETAKFKLDYPAYVIWAAAHPEIHA